MSQKRAGIEGRYIFWRFQAVIALFGSHPPVACCGLKGCRGEPEAALAFSVSLNCLAFFSGLCYKSL